MKNVLASQTIASVHLKSEINEMLSTLEQRKVASLLFQKDPTLWKADLTQQKEIAQRMGWLSLTDDIEEKADQLVHFAQTIKEEGYTHVVLLGMGGSSLSAEVARHTFGSAKGYPDLFILDDTSPEAILEIEHKINLAKTLFLVSSKSGNTQETLSFFRYFHDRLEKKQIKNPGNHFVAITDADTHLVKLAEQYHFKKVFITPSDIGGRYSVLSEFGLVPMALMGIDIKALLNSANLMATSCRELKADENPGFSLGVTMGVAQRHQMDKVTFMLSPSLRSFGFWVEQLLAESTGKDGKGLVPVIGEDPGLPAQYGKDRIFVHFFLVTDHNEDQFNKIKLLSEAGFVTISIGIKDKIELGGEYFRWEVATAIAAMVMEIDPFDQPNVEESKKNTTKLLMNGDLQESKDGHLKQKRLGDSILMEGKNSNLSFENEYRSAKEFIDAFVATTKPNSYIAILPYFLMTDHREKILQAWREKWRDNLQVATTMLSGPRYLHSTGQLHKGGPDTGWFIIIVGESKEDLAIPGSEFGFAAFHKAQALGDFHSLDDKDRNVIFIDLGKEVDLELSRI